MVRFGHGVFGLFRLSESPEQLWTTLQEAGQYDATLQISYGTFPRMLRRYVPPTPFARQTLFDRMLTGEPGVYTGFPNPSRGPISRLLTHEAGPAIINWLASRRSREKHRIYTGPIGVRRQLTLKQIAQKWRLNRTTFGVTDLHIRNTSLEEIINLDELSAFNILCNSSFRARAQEMFSFVISTRGYVTDSHSDAPDSSNFCFVGKKLWLSWDTYEGIRSGLQDVERMTVAGRALFDIESWLALPSARWFLVGPNQTLFLPSHLTHKVITMEPYVGVGSFFIALPNCLRMLSHWISKGPLWSKRDSTGHSDALIGDIAHSVRDKVLKLRDASQFQRIKWGYDFLEPSAKHFIKNCPVATFRTLWLDPRFRCVAETIQVPWPLPSDPH